MPRGLIRVFTTAMTDIGIPCSGATLPGLWAPAPDAFATLALAHGAGAGMGHRFMEQLAGMLTSRGVSVLRYEFPYMAEGKKRPDPPSRATAAVRCAVASAARLADGMPLFAGGKSFGGRMTSTAEADAALGVAGIVFFGFPLHAPGRSGTDRARHLFETRVPLLFLQGTRDKLADLTSIEAVCDELRRREGVPPAFVELVVVDGADHSFHVPRSAGRSDQDVLESLADDAVAWMRAQI